MLSLCGFHPHFPELKFICCKILEWTPVFHTAQPERRWLNGPCLQFLLQHSKWSSSAVQLKVRSQERQNPYCLSIHSSPLCVCLKWKVFSYWFHWSVLSTVQKTKTVWAPLRRSSDERASTAVKGVFSKSHRWQGQNSSPGVLTPSQASPIHKHPQPIRNSCHHCDIRSFSKTSKKGEGSGSRCIRSEQLTRIHQEAWLLPLTHTDTESLAEIQKQDKHMLWGSSSS